MKSFFDLREELESRPTELDELSSKTLSDYSVKASSQGMKRVGGQWMADQKVRKKDGYSSSAKVAASTNEAKKPKPGHNSMVLMKNIDKIKAAIKKEEVEPVSEISDKLKDRYLQRSQSHWQHMSAVARDSGTNDETRKKLRAKMKKRNQGMARAYGQTKDNW